MLTDEKRKFISRLKDEKHILINRELCSKCGGYCCEKEACILFPFDISPFTEENISYLLEKGYYSIRAFFESGKAYAFLTAREEGNDAFAILKSHKRCAHLTEKGCMFFDAERPTGGLALIPAPYYKCNSAYELEELEAHWKDEVVVKVMDEVLKKYIGNHSLTKICYSLFKGFEQSILNDTCSYNFATKYSIYHQGLRFGFSFKTETLDKIHS